MTNSNSNAFLKAKSIEGFIFFFSHFSIREEDLKALQD
jgi:hypothetical protein